MSTASAGLARRLGAWVYDALLVFALFAIATALYLPLTGGEAVTAASHPVLEIFYRVTLVAIVFAYCGYCWTRSGQTLGMLAWRIRVERDGGARLRWSDTAKRLAAATVSLLCLGLGYFWIWVDPRRRTWHDRWTDTRVVVLPKNARGSPARTAG